MLTGYETKCGPRKKYTKYVTLNMKSDMHKSMILNANKNDETISDFIRRSVKKEIERNS